jgi:hypothetical protein
MLYQLAARSVAEGFEDEVVTDVIERTPDVGIQNPRVSTFAQAEMALGQGIVAASAGTKAEAVCFESRFPVWLDRVLNNCLSDAV